MYHHDHYKAQRLCSVDGCFANYNRRSEMRHHKRIVHGIIEYADYDGPKHSEEYFMRVHMSVERGEMDDYPRCTGPFFILDTKDFVDADDIEDSVNKDPFRQHWGESKIPEGRILSRYEMNRIKV
jgi:hypothetical protein